MTQQNDHEHAISPGGKERGRPGRVHTALSTIATPTGGGDRTWPLGNTSTTAP